MTEISQDEIEEKLVELLVAMIEAADSWELVTIGRSVLNGCNCLRCQAIKDYADQLEKLISQDIRS